MIKKLLLSFTIALSILAAPLSALAESAPVTDTTELKIIDVSADSGVALALTSSGEVYHWGALIGETVAIMAPESIVLKPTRVESLPPIFQIATGQGGAFALSRDGEVYAWGSNIANSLGLGINGTEAANGENDGDQSLNGTAYFSTPVKISGLSNIKRIAAGGSYAFALTNDGRTFAWGYDRVRYLDHITGRDPETSDHIYTPTEINLGIPEPIADFAAGQGIFFALTESGNVYSWGVNTNGSLGIGACSGSDEGCVDIIYEPVKIDALSDVTALAASSLTQLAVNRSGELFGWGLNYYNNLLIDGVVFDQNSPIEGLSVADVLTPTRISALNNINKVSVNGYLLALSNAGKAYLWGNRDGALSSLDDNNAPIEINLSNVTSIAAGSSSLIFVVGGNQIYQLGGFFWEDGNMGTVEFPDGPYAEAETYIAKNTIITTEPMLVFEYNNPDATATGATGSSSKNENADIISAIVSNEYALYGIIGGAVLIIVIIIVVIIVKHRRPKTSSVLNFSIDKKGVARSEFPAQLTPSPAANAANSTIAPAAPQTVPAQPTPPVAPTEPAGPVAPAPAAPVAAPPQLITTPPAAMPPQPEPSAPQTAPAPQPPIPESGEQNLL